MKFVTSLFLLLMTLWGDTSLDSLQSPGADQAILKIMMSKPIDEVPPNYAVLFGTMYQKGVKEMNIDIDTNRALAYYESAAERNSTMGAMLAAKLHADLGRMDRSVDYLKQVVFAKDPNLSIPAGLELSKIYDQLDYSVSKYEVLLYLADTLDYPEAQYLIGMASITGEYKKIDAKTGRFYVELACSSAKAGNKLQQKCRTLTLDH